MLTIRDEKTDDQSMVREILLQAFGRDVEAKLVDELHRVCDAEIISLVAEVDGKVVGHIMFSPVSIEHGERKGTSLAPLAVLPNYQRKGIGSALVNAGIEQLRNRGYDFVIVFGHPKNYLRFGFEKASQFGLQNKYGVDDPFMVLVLHEKGLDGVSGLVKHHKVFDKFV